MEPGDESKKKIPGPIKLIRGFPNSPQTYAKNPRPRDSLPSAFEVGLLTPGSSSFRTFPFYQNSGITRNSSPVTAAGPSPIYTGFPIKLVQSTSKYFHKLNDKLPKKQPYSLLLSKCFHQQPQQTRTGNYRASIMALKVALGRMAWEILSKSGRK